MYASRMCFDLDATGRDPGAAAPRHRNNITDVYLVHCRFRVPEGTGRPLPSVADGGAAPTPHHLALRIWKRKESGAVLEVRLLLWTRQ
jgi:hypothetical protein